MPRRLTLLCAAKLQAHQLERHLELFEQIPEVERVIIVRHSPAAERLSKVENISFGKGPSVLSAVRMLRQVDRTIRSEKVDWVLGFNPVPWGSLALLAAAPHHLPVSLSLIGMDYRQIQKVWGQPFWFALQRASSITVTGQAMMSGLVARGIAPTKVHILPHSVDIERFVPTEKAKKYDVVSVGQLIERKRMDVLIDAVALLKTRGRFIRLGILGRGPLEASLRTRAQRLGVASQVEFIAYRSDVETIVSEARIFSLGSTWEGVPFALMEAMAAGLVPVVTDVGTISDWVIDEVNGRLFPVGDAAVLARCWDDLLANEGEQLARFQAYLIQHREKLSLAAGANVWREIFGLCR